MKNKKTIILLVVFLISVSLFIIFSPGSSGNAMQLVSEDFQEGGFLKSEHVFEGFGCKGGNKLPQLEVKNLPKDTKSIAITVYDPDAPTGSGWWHYLAYNIPADITEIKAEGTNIAGIADFGRNDFGTYNYGGPCPPQGHGKHHYIFTAYALNVEKLDLPKDASAALIGYNLNANTIEKASITALYER